MAAVNPTSRYRRIHGQLGHRVGASTLWRILNEQGVAPAPQRASMAWSGFLGSQAAVACDFACVDTIGLRRSYRLLFIDIEPRRVFYAGITAHPTGTWTTQAARNLFLRHDRALADREALVRPCGSQFTASFDEVFQTEGIRVSKTPVRTPVANAFAERWIGTLRRELLDRTLIWNRQQLERVVVAYIDHCNQHRPHRSLDQRSPRPSVPTPIRSPTSTRSCDNQADATG
jgi:hypothetical protein